MKSEKASKLMALKILKILQDYSSPEKPITTNEIIDKLKEYGLECTRQTVYSDIKLLMETGDYNIEQVRQRSNSYYITPEFELPELRILMDATEAARFIPKDKTETLVYKIASLAGSYSGDILKEHNLSMGRLKLNNKSILYNVDSINEAIKEDKKISFRYFDHKGNNKKAYRDNGAKRIENPCTTTVYDNNYYLIAYNEKHGNLINYRVDRMDSIEVTSKDRNIPDGLDLEKYIESQFGMFTGKMETVTMEAHNSLINVIVDKFGEGTTFKPVRGTDFWRFTVDVQVSNMFYSWATMFGYKLRVTHPIRVVKDIREYLNEAVTVYTSPHPSYTDPKLVKKKQPAIVYSESPYPDYNYTDDTDTDDTDEELDDTDEEQDNVGDEQDEQSVNDESAADESVNDGEVTSLDDES